MLASALSLGLALFAPTDPGCATVLRRLASTTPVVSSIHVPRNEGLRWHRGVPPRAVGHLGVLPPPPEGFPAALPYDDAIWTVADLDGDGVPELVVLTHLLQGHRPYWSAIKLYIFCGAQAAPCLEAAFMGRPSFTTRDANGVKKQAFGPRSYREFPLDLTLQVGLLRYGRGYAISVASGGKPGAIMADLYRWRRTAPMPLILRQCR